MASVEDVEVERVAELVLEVLKPKFEESYVRDKLKTYEVGYLDSLLTKVQQRCQERILENGKDVAPAAGDRGGESDGQDCGSGVLATLLPANEMTKDVVIKPNTVLIVGRSRGADVHLESFKVSRQHAKFWSNAERFFMSVLSRVNGVSLNERVVGREYGDEVVALHHGDEVGIAEYCWTVNYKWQSYVEKPPAHSLYDYNFEVRRKNARKRGERPFKNVVPATRNPRTSKSTSPASALPAIRHCSKDRLNARNRDLYTEQSVHLERGDEIDEHTSKLGLTHPSVSFEELLTPEDFDRPLLSSSPTPNSLMYEVIQKTNKSRDSSSSSNDVVIEREVFVY